MRGINTLISLTLIAGLGYSQCTGGLLGIPSAIAAGADVQNEELLMSIALIECPFAGESKAPQRNTTAEKKSGCSDGGSCLEQVQRSAIKHVATVKDAGGSAEEITPLALLPTPPIEILTTSEKTFERAGPLYALAHIAPHILLKRE